MRKKVSWLLGLAVLAFFLADRGHAATAEEKLQKMEKQLEAILGTDSNWKPAVLQDLRRGMPCAEVRGIKAFRSLSCRPGKNYDFPVVPGGFGKIKEYKFTFKEGLLQNVSIVFGARLLDEKRFQQALLNVAQRKWGALTPEKLAKPILVWTNPDLDTATLNKNGVNFQVKVDMPKHDSGDVAAGSLGAEQIKTELGALLGKGGIPLPKAFASYSQKMDCAQVKGKYEPLAGCDPAKEWSFGTVTIARHPLIHQLKFTFQRGFLRSVAVIFHHQLDYQSFKAASLAAFEDKWGRLPADQREKDLLTKHIRGFGIVQRALIGRQWQINFPVPK
ncbi:MAG: hypothetical protein JXO51_06385 [Candidatus Aminicenantes bacterium]|nr:hypothetical protein [Candidatus Aminicenantes bacterium]